MKIDLPAIFGKDIAVVEERFRLFFNNKPEFLRIVKTGLEFRFGTNRSDEIQSRVGLLDSTGMISELIIDAMLSGGQSYKAASPPFIWKRLIEHGVLFQSYGDAIPVYANHTINQRLLASHLNDDTFTNLFYPPAQLIKRYARSVLAVDAISAQGDPVRGTGFLVGAKGGIFAVTCKHNVDPSAGLSGVAFTDVNGTAVVVGQAMLSVELDIAVYPASGASNQPVFRLWTEFEVFDEVFTLGYPKVAGAHSLLVGHRGEVNGKAELYLERSPAIIVSNLVAPGNSGGPVLATDGHCVGMTFLWLENQDSSAPSRFSAALPAEPIASFIEATF